jgi:hypothetical protein
MLWLIFCSAPNFAETPEFGGIWWIGTNLTAGSEREEALPVRKIFVSFLIALFATPAFAGPNDVFLVGLIEDGRANDEQFGLLARELAIIFTPTSLQPAETTGQAGFDFGFDYGLHDINQDAEHWVNGVEGRLQGRALLPVMQTLGIRGRKGFILPAPLTSEAEFSAQWMTDSRLFSLGTNVRVALNEGFKWIPDLAVMGGVNTMIGSDEMTLVTASFGGSVSYGFGITGSFNFAPFVSYQAILYNAASGVIDADPTDTADVASNVVFQEVGIGQTENRIDRISFGGRFHVAILQFTAGADINLLPDGTSINQYSIRTGFYF